MQPIRSFVIRIYRQGKSRIDGVLEDVKSGRSVAFHDSQELWHALSSRRRPRTAGAEAGVPGTDAPGFDAAPRDPPAD